MKKTFPSKNLVLIGAIGVALLSAVVIAWQSAVYTLSRMSLKNVTTTQMAAAMRQDDFWSSNRFNTLVFNGQVKSVSTQGSKTTLEFATQDSYGAACELNYVSTKFQVGTIYTFAAEPYRAKRLPKGVLLGDCSLVARPAK